MAVSRGSDAVIKGEINITEYASVKNILYVGCLLREVLVLWVP